MRVPLTERQNQVYEFLRTYIRRNGKPPTLKEIGAHLDIRSTNGVHKMLTVLETKGYITRTKHEARGIDLVDEVAPASEESPGVMMLKLEEGVGRRARQITSETADHPLPRSRNPFLLDPSLLPPDVNLDHCLGVVAGDDGMSGVGIRKSDTVVIEEMAAQDVTDGALVAVLFFDRVVIRQFAILDGRYHFRTADRSYADVSAGPYDPEYFVLGQALALMRSLG